MNEEALNMSVRKFLKKVGVTSQREIEDAVRQAVAEGRVDASSPLQATMTLSVSGIDLDVEIEGAIDLE